MIQFFYNLLDLSLEAAPWLVMGLALGGLMKALIPTEFLQRHLSGDGLGAISKATILGAPLPLCSCGVIPVALGLRKAGASKPATAAFMVSTPETGVDSISVTYAMMGPFMAIVRPVSALLSAVAAGSLVAIFDPQDTLKQQRQESVEPSCCSSESKEPVSCCGEDYSQETPASSCCSSGSEVKKPDSQISANKQNWLLKGWGGIHYAFTRLLGDIVFWLGIGMLFAAATKTFLPTDFLAEWGSGITAMLIMVLAGIPMYICATASTPVAAGLMMAGVSPGVALVWLLTGPATNVSTLGVISKELGRRSMWLYLTAVSVTAVVCGLVVNVLVDFYRIDVLTYVHASHDGLPAWLQLASLALLIVTVIFSQLPAKARTKNACDFK